MSRVLPSLQRWPGSLKKAKIFLCISCSGCDIIFPDSMPPTWIVLVCVCVQHVIVCLCLNVKLQQRLKKKRGQNANEATY